MKIIRIFTAVILTFTVLFTAFYGRYKIGEQNLVKNPVEYKGVLSVWQIDNFEGGTGSRKQFLLKVARNYEKKRQGVLVMVTNYTLNGAEQAMKEGKFPDMISYGNGLNVSGAIELSCSKHCLGGTVGKKCFAVAWCRGGYTLISNPLLTENKTPDVIDNLLVSQGEFTQPLTAFALENVSVKKLEVMQPMDAYVKFTAGKTPYFLGTQRDINRLKNRGFEFSFYPLSQFNDLYQYISVTTQDLQKNVYAQEFIEHLLSENVQKSLSEIGMFSPYFNAEYQDQDFISMQNVEMKKTISTFTPKEKLHELQDFSRLAVMGDDLALNKIKNLLI